MSGAVTVGRLVVSVSGDVDQLKIDMREAQAITGSATKEMAVNVRAVSDETDKATSAGKRMVAALQEEVRTFGMSREEILVYKASLTGAGEEVGRLAAQLQALKAAQAAADQEMAAASSAFRGHGAAANEAGGHVEEFGFKTASAKRELLVLAHELSQGNYKRFGGSMMVLGEQTGAAGLLFSAAGIAAIGMGAAIIGAAVAIEKGAAEQRAMNNALIMSGNYAGQTSDSLNALAHAAVESGGSIGEAKKAVTQLAESGKFTGDQLGSITSAVVAMEHATGASIEETIKQFESLSVQAQGHSARASTAISQATVKLDEQYHFLTLSVYDQITALEKEGDLKAASKIATDEFASVTRQRAEEIIGNLGHVASAWHGIKEAIGGAIDYMGEWGKKSTAASEIERIKFALSLNASPNPGFETDQHNELVRQLGIAQAALNKENKVAFGQAAETLAQSNAVQAAQRIDAMLLRAQTKEQGALTTSLKEYHESLDRIRAGSTTEDIDPRLTDKAIKAGEAALIKLHSQAIQGNDDRSARLQDALILEQTALDREKSIYEARGKMLDTYHKSLGMSDADFYDGEKTRHAEYVASEAIAFARESALIQASAAANPQEIAARKQRYDALIKQHLDFVDKMNAVAVKDSIAPLVDAKKLMDDYVTSLDKAGATAVKSLDAQIAKERQHGLEIGLTKAQIDNLHKTQEQAATDDLQAQAEAIDQLLKQNDLNAQAREIYAAMLPQINAQIEARRTLAQISGDNAVREADAKAAADASKAWKHTADTIQTDLTNAILDGGGRGFKKLIRDMEMGFARMILQPILAPISGGISSLINPLAAQAGAGGMLGTASAGVSAYNALSNIGTTVTGVGTMLGSSTIGAFGSGISAGLAGTSVADAAAAYTAAGMTGVSGGLSAGAAVGGAVSDGVALLGAIPGWGWAALGAAAIGAYLLNDGPEQNTRLGFTSNNTPGNISINERGNEGKNSTYIDPGVSSAFGTFGVNSSFWMSSSSPTVTSFLDTVAKTDDALASFLTTTEKASVSSYLTGKVSVANMGAEGTDPNANGALDRVFAQRINNILTGVEPGLASLISDFKGTSQQLATESAALLQYRSALRDAGEAVFGVKVTLQDIAALKTPTESTSAALTRVTGEFNATNAVAAALGKTSGQAFGVVGLASESARAQLILAAGGISALQQNTAGFAQNFLSDAERLAPAAKAMASTFAAMGLALPNTREQFKSLVMGLDLTTQQGATTYASLMSVQDAFAQLHPIVAGAEDSLRSAADVASERSKLQDQLDQLTMSSTHLLDKQRNALDAANRPLFDMVQAAQKLADTSSNMTKFRDAAMSLHDGLLTGSLSTLTPEQQYAETKRQYDQTLAAAKGGDATAQGQYSAMATAFLTASQKVNASDPRYTSDLAGVLQTTDDLSKWASGQVDVAQASLDALNKQVIGIGDLNASINALPQSLAQALSGVTPASDALPILAGTAQIDGSHANGLPYVPFDGYRAELHKGEQVLTANEAINYRNMGRSDMGSLVSEIKALRQEVTQLRADNERQSNQGIAATVGAAERNGDKVAQSNVEAARTSSWSAQQQKKTVIR